MSDSTQRENNPGNWSRRDLLYSIALSVTAVGFRGFSAEAGALVHSLVGEEKGEGNYQPLLFKEHEFQTLRRLTELIIPADEHSGSALDAGAPEFIDLLCSGNAELAHIYRGGLAWLDGQMSRQHGSTFLAAAAEDQHRMLDSMARETRLQEERELAAANARFRVVAIDRGYLDYTTEEPTELGPGGQFFSWVRRMTVDAFYTSPVGIQDVGYEGNGYWEKYRVPQEAIDYVLKRSPLREDQ